MITVVAYEENQGIGAVNADLDAIQDDSQTIVNNHFIFKRDVTLLGAYAAGIGMSRPRVNTPALRRLSLPSIQPVQIVQTVPTRPAYADLRDLGLVIPGIDEVAVESTNTDAGAQDHAIILWVSDGNMNRTPGQIYTVRATNAAITLVQNAWVTGALTFEQTLPAGTYEVQGMYVECADALCARLLFPEQVWRPGCIPAEIEGEVSPEAFRYGRLGAWGRFASFAVPQIEVLGHTAGAEAVAAYLDLVKVA